MNGPIFVLTMRQMLGRRRTLLMALFALLPVLIATVFRIGDPDVDQYRWTTNVLMNGLVVATLLPLAALVFGTASLGAEIEDGTAVYLLAKPVARRSIIAAKLAAAWLSTGALVVPAALVAGALALGGSDDHGILAGFGIATLLGSLTYAVLFVLLSVVTSRALIGGLVYVFLWEGLVTQLFTGTRFLSVRQYCLGIADGLVDLPGRIFEARLGMESAAILLAVVTVAGFVLAVRRLEAFETREPG